MFPKLGSKVANPVVPRYHAGRMSLPFLLQETAEANVSFSVVIVHSGRTREEHACHKTAAGSALVCVTVGMWEEELDCIVVDVGTQHIQAGRSGDDHPAVIRRSAVVLSAPPCSLTLCPTRDNTFADHDREKRNLVWLASGAEVPVVGDWEHIDALNNAERASADGIEAPESSSTDDSIAIAYPIAGGVIHDWEAAEVLFNQLFRQELHADPTQRDVLLSVPPLLTKSYSLHVIKMLKSRCGARSVALATGLVLRMYASGRTTGCVLDVGASGTRCLCIYEGYAIEHSIMRSRVGGDAVCEYFAVLMREAGYDLGYSRRERESVERFTRRAAFVRWPHASPHPVAEATMTIRGEAVVVEQHVRAECCEVLFEPAVGGLEQESVVDVVLRSILHCPIGRRKDMYHNLVVSGGASCYVNFLQRLFAAIIARAPGSRGVKLVAPPMRIFSGFVGASILSSLSIFRRGTAGAGREVLGQFDSGLGAVVLPSRSDVTSLYGPGRPFVP